MGNLQKSTSQFRLPDDIIEEVRQYLEEGEVHQWALGRYLQDVIEEFGEQHRPEIIRQLANATGAHPSTLRDRHCVAVFFSPDEQSEYPFSYSQFRALKSAGHEHWREHAEYWAEHLPAPVSAIRNRIKGNGHLSSVWRTRFEMLEHMAQLIADDKEAPMPIRVACRQMTGWNLKVYG